MPIHFRLDVARKRVYACTTPPLRDRDVIAYQYGLAGHPDHGHGFDQIIDARPLGDSLDISTEGVRQASRVAEDFRSHLLGTKLAIVVGGAVVFGMARMLSAYSEGLMDVRVFSSMESAEAWVDQVETETGS